MKAQKGMSWKVSLQMECQEGAWTSVHGRGCQELMSMGPVVSLQLGLGPQWGPW